MTTRAFGFPLPSLPTDQRLRVAFLFNAQLHQVLHGLPIAASMATAHADVEVSILAPSEPHFRFIRRYLPPGSAPRIRLVQLQTPLWVRLYRLVSRGQSGGKTATLGRNRALLAGFDALVTPERTSVRLKDMGLDTPPLVHSGHGAGDRERSFNPEIRRYDLALLSGRKYEDRLLELGLIRPGHYAVVGYPKFDLRRPPAGRLFPNDRPTLLYAPHFDPKVSSWPGLGRPLLEQALASRDYNLVFAPHVRLFDSGPWWRRWEFHRARKADHILVDLGSDRSIDMTYTDAADIYVGDVSSQLYEFLLRPRPCIFLDAHRTAWQDDPFHLGWRCGPVIGRIADLPAAIARSTADHETYLAEQRRLFAYTFDLNDHPSARRAADAIVAFLRRERGIRRGADD